VRSSPVVALAAIALVPGCFLFGSKPSPSCPEGKVVELGLQEDVTRVAGCPRAGGVTIRTGATIDVSPLHDLEEIDGDLAIGPTVGVDSVAFNGLLRVGGTIRIVSNGSLRGVFLPRLEHAGRVEIDGNAVLTTISMPRLQDLAGSLVITDNNGLELVSASTLTAIGAELVIVGHPKLNLLELPRLARLETIRIEGNPKVSPELVEELRAKATMP
jgi:hypothetical protein